MTTETRHETRRIRHETRRRRLTIARTSFLTPKMVRIEFTSPDLHDFVSAAPDDHVKLHIPDAASETGVSSRDYTPRRFDPAKGTLTVDFAVHDDVGPATRWALEAKVGDQLEIGGPRGSRVVPDDFDWYLLIGDETALPAIGRRLEELRGGVPVTTVVLVDTADETQHIETRAAWTSVWVSRREQAGDDVARLRNALAQWKAPAGEGYVWMAAEAAVASALREYMVQERGHPLPWLKSAGYWVRGAAGTSDKE